MARVQTPITGISTTSTHDDGATASLVNLRPKNGALIPVTPRKIEQQLSQKYDIIFIHHNDDYENWIGVVNGDDSSSIYWDIKNTPSLLGTLPGAVNSVQQVGNTLSLISDSSISYILYNGGAYILLGEIPQVPPIKFFSRDTMRTQTVSITDTDPTLDSVKAAVYGMMESIDETFGIQLYDAHFFRYAFRLFDGSLTKHSPPILVMPQRRIVGGYDAPGSSIKTYIPQWQDRSLSLSVWGYRPYINYDLTMDGEWDNWKDIIESVDVFMSPALGISNIEKLETVPRARVSDNPLDLLVRVSDKDVEAVESAASFYFLRSIPLGSVNNDPPPPLTGTDTIETTGIPTNSDIEDLSNLIYKELMPDDQFSNHSIGAKGGHVYNGRLSLWGVKTTLFEGFDERYFQWYGSQYDGVSAPTATVGSYISEVEIEINGTINRVYSVLDGVGALPGMFGTAFLSYPDARATKISIYHVDEYDTSIWNLIFSARLKPHDFLNLAYCLNNALAPIVGQDLGDYTPRDVDNIVSVFEGNKIKTSEITNPLVYPAANTYEVGDGNILALASNAMNVSDRNFGQWPLYVFTDRGIWVMAVGDGAVAFSSIIPVSNIIVTTPSVCETPYGVVFTNHRGLMIINGQSVSFLSPQIEQKRPRLNIEMNENCDGVVFPVSVDFVGLMSRLSSLVYDPYENELIVNTGELNYVYNFNDKLFYQSTEAIDLVVQNTLPELYVTEGLSLKNYATSEVDYAHVQIITRPLRFKISDIKRFGRTILRSLLYGVQNPNADKFSLSMVHYSNDGVNFIAARGLPIKEGNHRDIDLGLFSRIKARFLLFVFAGITNDKSRIFYLDSEVDKEYGNDKMR